MTLIRNESTATTICNFEHSVVPGLLQTRNYTEAVVRSSVWVPPENIELLVQARMERQKLLKGYNSPEATFFINESALRTPTCSPTDMVEQLLHLVFMTSHTRVHIRVLPTNLGSHAAMRGPFMFMGFGDRRPVVYLEGDATSTFVEDREIVELYRTIRTELHKVALDEEESRRFLAEMASAYDREVEERSRCGGPEQLA
jgi:hypothetical protein